MIYTTLHVTDTIFAFALVVLLVVILKKKKVVPLGDLKKYSKLMTMAILPAVIFLQLSLNPVHFHQFILVLIMFSAMPSAVLGTVFATQYLCDSETASEVVFLNIMFSLIGLTLVYYSMFH